MRKTVGLYSFLAFILLSCFLTGSVYAQTASPTATLTVSPTDTATPTPTNATTNSATPSKTASPAADEKKKVLGAATKLGETGFERDLTKWLFASIAAISLFFIGFKVMRNVEKE